MRPNAGSPAIRERGGVLAELFAGTYELRIDAGRVDLRCRNVARRQLLAALAERAGFEVDPEVSPVGRVTGELADRSLTEAVAWLLGDEAFVAHYALSDESAETRLVRVSPADLAVMHGGDPAIGVASGLNVATRETADQQLLERWRLANVEQNVRLSSGDPSERREVIEFLELEGGAISLLDEVLRQDPSAEVRITALERLSESPSLVAFDVMTQALSDPDGRVVVRALDMIEETMDAELVPRFVEPLVVHPDPTVRARAEEVAESIGFYPQ